jgi:hypothetical protein
MLGNNKKSRSCVKAKVSMSSRIVARSALLIAVAVLLPAVAVQAQVITGVARDASGAILPGVTVEVSSPALIEQVRTVVTDGVGQYRVVNLRPGTYAATFTLPGFATVKRDGIEVAGDAVFTINVEMRVGELTETITVSGATPVVDVQSVRRQSVLTSDVVSALPSTRNYAQLLNAVPALQNGDLDSQVPIIGQNGRFFNSYGGRPNEGRLNIDGMGVGQAYNGGGVGFAPDPSTVEEMQITIAGGLGEQDVSSAMVNFVPKTGGNTFRGQTFVSTSGDWSQTTNLDDELRSFGISQAGLIKQWDVGTSFGGPVMRDRLWFFMNGRTRGDYLTVPGRFANLNAGDPTKWNYVKDSNVSVRNAGSTTNYLARVTAQVTPRNKVNLSIDQQFACSGSALDETSPSCRPRGSDWIAQGTATASPEATSVWTNNTPLAVVQATWSSPVTSRLLLDAGVSSFHSRWGWMEPPGALTDFIPVTETASNATTGTPVPSFTYRGLDNMLDNNQTNTNWRASVSYVTGAHNLKAGYQGAVVADNQMDLLNDSALTYTFNNGQPTSFSMRIGPWQVANRTAWYGIYVQDQWTVGRATIQGALRYDRAWSWFPSEGNGAPQTGRFNAAPISFPATDGVTGFNDVTPRVGVAYDLFGNGRTAVKATLGKYLSAATNQPPFINANPAVDGRGVRATAGQNFVTSTTRSWIDGNANKVVDCDLLNPALHVTGGDTCGAWANQNFRNPFALQQIDPTTQKGWGVRPSDWYFGASVQQQLFERVALDVAYNRRSFSGFFVVDNLAVGPADYDPYTVTVPLHPDLPDGGGYSFQALSIKPEKFGQFQNYFTSSSNYGGESHYWHGFDITLNARPRSGLVLSGGTSTGRGVNDNCDIVAALPETLGVNQRAGIGGCDIAEPWLTSFRGSAVYTVPKIDLLVSTIVRFQNTTVLSGGSAAATSGPSLVAILTIPNTVVAQSLGRLPAGGLPNGTTSVNALIPGELYPEQVRTMDVRIAKVFRFGRSRTDVGIDVFNVFNSNAGTVFNSAFGLDGATWNRPTTILNPRAVRFNLTVVY